MNVPQLRFSGFDGEWEKKSFYECVEIKGKLVNPRNEEYQELPHIGPGNIEKFTGQILKYELVKNEELISGKFEFDHKDVVYSKIRPELNKVVFPEFNGLCSADAYPLRAIEGVMEPYFLFQQLMSPKFIKYSISVSMRTGMPKINREELAGFVFHLPKLTEQKKVSKFFRLLNLRIQKQQEKIKHLDQFKKGVMQKIFSQELRFRDEDGGEFSEWEEKLLSQISVINPKTEPLQEQFYYIDLESVDKGRVGDLKTANINGAPSRAQRVLMKNDVLFQTVRPYQQNHFYVEELSDKQIVASTGFAQIRTNESARYIYYLVHTEKFSQEVLNRCTGTSYPAINSNHLGKINVPVPSLVEQEKIGDFLLTLDKKLSAEKEKLMVLEEQKKGFMQGMFV